MLTFWAFIGMDQGPLGRGSGRRLVWWGLYPIPLMEASEYLVGQPTPRLEVPVTNKGSTKK